MPPSRFAARFSAAVGERPMAYLTKCRMSLACRERMTARGPTIEQIATSLGYDNQAAFRRLGLNPALGERRPLLRAGYNRNLRALG
jgi:AraC-like DNA-binding protein